MSPQKLYNADTNVIHVSQVNKASWLAPTHQSTIKTVHYIHRNIYHTSYICYINHHISLYTNTQNGSCTAITCKQLHSIRQIVN